MHLPSLPILPCLSGECQTLSRSSSVQPKSSFCHLAWDQIPDLQCFRWNRGAIIIYYSRAGCRQCLPCGLVVNLQHRTYSKEIKFNALSNGWLHKNLTCSPIKILSFCQKLLPFRTQHCQNLCNFTINTPCKKKVTRRTHAALPGISTLHFKTCTMSPIFLFYSILCC